jgi:UDP-glucose 4-epimerase
MIIFDKQDMSIKKGGLFRPPYFPLSGQISVDSLEHILSNATYGADPIVGKILEGYTRLDPSVGITNCRVILVSAYGTQVLLHPSSPFVLIWLFLPLSIIRGLPVKYNADRKPGGVNLLLVTGGAGYIGSHVVLGLLDQGREVLVIDNLSRGHRELAGKAVFEEADIRDLSQTGKIFRKYPIDGVLHFAALSLVEDSMSDPHSYFRNNIGGTMNIITSMLESDIDRIVFSSSAAVYGEPRALPVKEEAPKIPTNPYGETKLFIESMLRRSFEAYGTRSVSLRYFNAAGADPLCRTGEDHSPETHLIPIALDVVMGRKEELKIFGNDYPTHDGTCVRDYVHVADLADAHIRALEGMEKGTLACEAFNLGNGKGFSVLEIVSAVRSVTGIGFPLRFAPRRAGDPAVLVASSDRAERELSWKRRYKDMDEIIETAWKWHQKRFRPRRRY